MSETNLKDLLCVLNTEICYIFDNEESFLKRFGPDEFWDLQEVSFTSHHIKIVFVLYSGQNVGDTVAMSDYCDWKYT